jgi:hypothetical protein
MLFSRPSSIIRTNVFGEIWISHRSLSSSDTSSKGLTPRFHTPGFVQGLEVDSDEHRKATNMIQ